MSKPPVAEQVQVNFRMPADLRDRLRAEAEENNRSLNAEIVSRLEASFDTDDGRDVVADLYRKQRVETDREIFELREAINALRRDLTNR